ncbi:sigma-70 domain-containing protein [Streptomyces sp. NPDC020598]|uniref:sigma-70 domain-containing protein n=1 Tax=Streptomyces sp. NPDC020598 TaxID=3365081 RepID=UPI0037A754D8
MAQRCGDHRRVARVRRELLRGNGADPTPEEVPVRADVPVERLAELNAYDREPVSLHTVLSDEGGAEFDDFIVGVTYRGVDRAIVSGRVRS